MKTTPPFIGCEIIISQQCGYAKFPGKYLEQGFSFFWVDHEYLVTSFYRVDLEDLVTFFYRVDHEDLVTSFYRSGP